MTTADRMSWLVTLDGVIDASFPTRAKARAHAA